MVTSFWSGGKSPAPAAAYFRPSTSRIGVASGAWAILACAVLLAVIAGLMTAVGAGFMAVILVVATVLAVAGLIDYRIVVIALMAVFPLTGTYFFPRKLLGITGFNPFNVLWLFAVASFALHRLFAQREGRYPLPNPAFFWPLILAMVAAAAIGSRSIHLIPEFFHLNSETFKNKAEYFRDVGLKPMMVLGFVYLIGASVARSRSQAPWVWAVLLGGSGLSLLILFFVASSGVSIGSLSGASTRSFLTPTGLHANEMGVALIPLFAASLFVMPALARLRSRLAAGVICGIALCAIALTFSRAAFLAVFIVGVAFALKRKRLIWVVVGLVAVCTAVLFAPEPLKDRVMRGFASGSVGSSNDPLTAGRVSGIWTPLLPDIEAHALFGNGIESTMWSKAARSGLIGVSHPHNAYIRLVMDFGIVFGAFVLLYLWRVWALWRRLATHPSVDPVLRAFFDGICVAFLAFLLQCMSGTTLIFGLPHAIYLSAIGVALGVLASLPNRDVAASAGKTGLPERRFPSAH